MLKTPYRILSILLAAVLLTTFLPMKVFAETIEGDGETVTASYSYTSPSVSNEYVHTPAELTPEDVGAQEAANPPGRRAKEAPEAVGEGAWNGSTVYSDGVIYINNYTQLSLIGSGTPVTDADLTESAVGTGNKYLLSGTGTEDDPYVYAGYTNDAVYYLANDIPLPSRTAWNVPAGFTGYFTSAVANGADNSKISTQDTRLFDVVIMGTDKVYYHNVFPLAENAGAAIHDNDYDVFTYGEGGLYGRSYLDTHAYVLASNFTAKTVFDVTETIEVTDGSGQTVTAIVIRNYDQLKLVGLGESVLEEKTINGIKRIKKVNYPPDAVYYLANDIQLADDGWQLPDSFTGSFTCDPSNAQTDSQRLYERREGSLTKADVYVQNIYQLEMLGKTPEERAEEPLLDHDYDPQYFGAGSTVYLTAVSTDYLTYGTENTYILSRTFSNRREDQIYSSTLEAIANNNYRDGRDFFGQTTVEIGGDAYILIGDRQQLDAIGSGDYVYGPVYAVTQTRNNIAESWKFSSVSLVYPGDADLIAGIATTTDGETVQDFSTAPRYGEGNYHALGTYRNTNLERVIYCAAGEDGGYNVRATSQNANRGSQRYTRDAKYIVFRDIDMRKTYKTNNDYTWQPLMFSGEMYGVKAEQRDDRSTLWSEGKTDLNINTARKPVISYMDVRPAVLTEDGQTLLNLNKQIGVGFFGTLSGKFNSSSIMNAPVVVKNIKLKDGSVNNPAVNAAEDPTILNQVFKGLSAGLGAILDPVLQLLIGKNLGVRNMLDGLLDARKSDPASLATGAFAGRIIGKATVEDCEVENVSVTAVKTNYENKGKIVGQGGFVGHVEGETSYDVLSNTLGVVGDSLADILNAIPGLGLGDLVTVLLDNGLLLKKLIPTGYVIPEISRCAVNNGTLTSEAGKIGVGGFAGSVCGTVIRDSTVKNCANLDVFARELGGGFAGVTRDAFIQQTLSGLGINVARAMHPQSELIRCSIENSNINVHGGKFLGGFTGALANSYGINDTIDAQSNITVSASQDYAGGFTGSAMLGTLLGMSAYLVDENDLLGVVKGLLTGLLGQGADQSLLELGGVASSAVMGCQLLGNLTVSAQGSYAGGFLGRGNGVYLTASSEQELSELPKYKYGAELPINTRTTENTTSETRGNYSARLKNNTAQGQPAVAVYAGRDFAGGIAGYLTSANVGGLLGDTAGIGQFLGFTVSDTTVRGTEGGFSVETGHDFAGGGIGWAVGGDVRDDEVEELLSVKAHNRAGGFVGATGPGNLVSGEGLDLQLLGISLLKISNLAQVVPGVKTTYTRANVTGHIGTTGADSGFTVVQNGSAAGDSAAAAATTANTDATEETTESGGGSPASTPDEASDGDDDANAYTAGGFAAEANSVTVTDCHVSHLRSVQANNNDGIAGGFVAHSAAGGLANVVDKSDTLSLVNITDLISAVDYLVPVYNGCDVTYENGGFASGDIAGGFTGDFRSGYINNRTVNEAAGEGENPYAYEGSHVYTSGIPDEAFAVYNISHVAGQTYAGGFGGKVHAGSLASAGGGVSILGKSKIGSGVSIELKQLLKMVNTYVPIIHYAGVYSPNGFTVEAVREESDSNRYPGSAGGYIGFASGAQISYSDVYRLAHTKVIPPNNLEALSAPTYYTESDYAVKGTHYAGGYFGVMDLGNAASVGGSVNALNLINLENILSAFSVVVTTVEHSNVEGAAGGFSVFSNGTDKGRTVGMSGGFAGANYGGHIQNSHCKNFYYIIGQESAGGYVGTLQPGSVADLLKGQSSVLGNLLKTNGALASLLNTFVPTIRNSTTSCVPCGGAVRADAESDATYQRGCAGGYCGHNMGSHIWGNNDATWIDLSDRIAPGHDFSEPTLEKYKGEQHECAAYRIRSVYGAEYAGGYTGFMESADFADAGSVELLGGLLPDANILSVSNLLGALQVVYPTEENTAVYGPMRGLDVGTWNAWVKYVGKYGGYALDLIHAKEVKTATELNDLIGQYIYGYNVVAGRQEHVTLLASEGGDAGGYVGLMVSGRITNGQAYDAKLVQSMRSTGGYAGRMRTGAAANLGGAGLLGMVVNLSDLVSLAQVFVPIIKSSSVHGYQAGLTVNCTGADEVKHCGYAGGYLGSGFGAQILGDKKFGDADGTGCNVYNLRFVRGDIAVGGYVGMTAAASVANVNTNASEGLLQGLLDRLIGTPGDLAKVMEVTITRIRKAEVNPDNADFGFVLEGADRSGMSGSPGGGASTGDEAGAGTSTGDEAGTGAGGSKTLPRIAGGFAGSLEAAVIGSRENESVITVNGLRSVDAQYYAGGFVGLADVGGVAKVSSSGSGGTSVLSLIRTGGIDVLDIFRTYIYYSDVNGVSDGMYIRANRYTEEGMLKEKRYSGCAGGFGGAVMNGTVKNCSVTNLSTVVAPNYTGGFIGHMGKNGVADVDKVELLGLADLTAGVLDVFGTVAEHCTVTGITAGTVVHAAGGAEPIAGGFVGYADLSQVKNSGAYNLKQIYSDQIAGGFVGKTNMKYLLDTQVESWLVDLVLDVVNELVKMLYLPEAERVNLLNINIPGLNKVLALRVLSEGDLLYVNLLGLRVGVSLSKSAEEGGTDVAIVTIGDSAIRLNCTENGINKQEGHATVEVNLIKANRTRIEACHANGIAAGYDVYGGGASNDSDGEGAKGFAGGFVGYNYEGMLSANQMEFCDVVRGAPGKVGPFSGETYVKSVYDFQNLLNLEGEANQYSVYRKTDLTYLLTSNNRQIGSTAVTQPGPPITYNRFDVIHLAQPIEPGEGPYSAIYDKWIDAKLASNASGADAVPAEVYTSSAKAVLMLDIPTRPNDESLVPVPGETKDPCDDETKLTIQKIWDDWNNMDGMRPGSIRVRIWQHWYAPANGATPDGAAGATPDGAAGATYDEPPLRTVLYIDKTKVPDMDDNGWFTLSQALHGRVGSSTWMREIEGLPVTEYQRDPVTQDILTDPQTGEKLAERYYRYTVEEQAVEGYETNIRYGGGNRTTEATITNRHRPILPITGSWTDVLLVLIGAGLILTAVMLFKRKRVAEKSGGKSFRPPRGSPPHGKSEAVTNKPKNIIKKGLTNMTKRIFAVLMALALVLTMTVTAFAAEGTPATGSLTVTGNELTGKTVDAYRVFTASWVDKEGTGDDKIDSSDTVSYVLETAWEGFFSAVPAIAADTSNKSLSEKATNYIAGLSDAQVLQLAKDLKAYAKTQNIAPSYTSAAATNNSVTITGMVPGYYLVIPQSGSTSADRGTDATLLNVPSEASASWAIKSDYPTVEKTVDNNKKESTAKIGDVLDFKLTANIPDMTEYENTPYYTLMFNDTFSSGLTYTGDDDVAVKVVDPTTDADKKTLTKGTDYAVAYDTTTSKLTITIGKNKTVHNETTDQDEVHRDLKSVVSDYTQVEEGDKIVVTYKAMLNENAVIAGTGNGNTANVQYSNDPSDATSIGTSSDSETKTYTYEMTIDKHDDSATPVQLAGAVFTLKDSSDNVIKLIGTGTDNEYRVANADEIAAANSTVVETVTTPASGLVKIIGLAEGTYHLEEVAAPTGYNKLGADIVITVGPTTDSTVDPPVVSYGTPGYSVDGTPQANDSTINVVNTKGSVLPTTGSVGTIGLTAAGVGVVVLGIVLTSRKKKSNKAE